jgi:hypothetical protein
MRSAWSSFSRSLLQHRLGLVRRLAVRGLLATALFALSAQFVATPSAEGAKVPACQHVCQYGRERTKAQAVLDAPTAFGTVGLGARAHTRDLMIDMGPAIPGIGATGTGAGAH